VLPSALPGICTGVILAISRALGEAAPLFMVGALAYITSVPSGPMDRFTALPIQIYNWTMEPHLIFRELAAAAILVLLAILLVTNGVAVTIRGFQQRKKLQ
jgi:phosphate transport system permease protein